MAAYYNCSSANKDATIHTCIHHAKYLVNWHSLSVLARFRWGWVVMRIWEYGSKSTFSSLSLVLDTLRTTSAWSVKGQDMGMRYIHSCSFIVVDAFANDIYVSVDTSVLVCKVWRSVARRIWECGLHPCCRRCCGGFITHSGCFYARYLTNVSMFQLMHLLMFARWWDG